MGFSDWIYRVGRGRRYVARQGLSATADRQIRASVTQLQLSNPPLRKDWRTGRKRFCRQHISLNGKPRGAPSWHRYCDPPHDRGSCVLEVTKMLTTTEA